jgi:predicted GNAT family N-acyltransferase
MIFKEIVFGSSEFADERALRDRILRVPLGLALSDDDFEAEKDQLHFGLFAASGELAACVIAVPTAPGEAKIRQMAVALEHQGRSHGRMLMLRVEEELSRRGIRHLFLHARIPAVPFYEKIGFEKQGAGFIEVGIPHVEMTKDIRPPIV